MVDTPFGETCTVEELVKYAQVVVDDTPAGDGPLDTRRFPVIIRVIEQPAIIRTDEEGGLEVLAEAETRNFALETEDIEVTDNAVWLIVGPRPETE